jgi:membrane fusion protein (multidrug efflux system)
VAALAEANATLENARTNLGYTKIRSTHDGVIGTIPYKIGALVSSTSTSALTTLSDISKVYAYFALDEKQLLQLQDIKPGAALQELLDKLPGVQLVLADGSIYPYKGKLETASGLVTTGTGSISFKALYPNPNGTIRSGASAVVRIPRANDSAIIIPQSATSEIQDKRLVYVVGDGDKIHAVSIGTTASDDGKYFIVSTGLKSGDQIVLDGITSLKDSLQIKPTPVKSDSVYAKLQTGN